MNETIINEFRSALEAATEIREKSATFHALVLIHVDMFTETADYADFCRQVGMPESFKIELGKIVNQSKVLQERGYGLTRIS